jgi:hypothetical protein
MSLFWKIFVWFWSAMVVMGAALWGVVTATRPDPLPSAWRQATSQSLPIYAAQSAEAFEKGGAKALAESLRHLRNRGRNRLWLFDQSAHSLSGDPQAEKEADFDEESFGAPRDGG